MNKKSKAAKDMGVNDPLITQKYSGKKMHHAPDYAKNKDADVIPKDNKKAVPNEHWERFVGSSVFAEGFGDDAAGAFLARPGKDRAQPHEKINECDH